MAKHMQRTKILINGVDVSPYVFRCNIPRSPEAVDTVELVLEVDKFEVADNGTLVVHVNIEE